MTSSICSKRVVPGFVTSAPGRFLLHAGGGLACRLPGLARKLFLLLARLARRGCPSSSFMLRRYLAGAGDVAIADDRLARDPGFLARVAVCVPAEGRSGRFEVPQWHLDSLDLRCALGSFAVDWHRCGQALHLDCSGEYAWRPGDAARPTAPLHRAAASVPGAHAFQWSAAIAGMKVPGATAWTPRDRVYM